MSYDLPVISNNYRWYLAKHSNRYGCLKLQEKTWRGWVDIESEMISLTGQPLPFDVTIKQAADEIIRVIEAPDVEYGVIS